MEDRKEVKLAYMGSVDSVRLLKALGLEGQVVTHLRLDFEAGKIFNMVVHSHVTEEQFTALTNELETSEVPTLMSMQEPK